MYACVTSHTRKRIPRTEREPLMLDAAERVFSASGFHGASMDAIAAAAGISKPMVYNYFGSKEGIYLAYLERAGRDLLNRLIEADLPEGRLGERLAAGAGAFFGFVGENHDGWRVLREEMVGQRESVGGQVATMRSAVSALLSEVLVEEGDDPRLVDAHANALTGAGESLADWWLEHPATPVEVLVDTLVAMAERLPGSADMKGP